MWIIVSAELTLVTPVKKNYGKHLSKPKLYNKTKMLGIAVFVQFLRFLGINEYFSIIKLY